MRTTGSPRQIHLSLLAAWQRTRHPRVATLCERVLAARLEEEAPRPAIAVDKTRAAAAAWEAVEQAGDPLDTARLGAACGSGSREDVGRHVAALARRDDPGLAAAMLALLADPPYCGAASRKLTQQILDALAGTRDRRAAEPARDLGARYLSIRGGKGNAPTSTKLAKIADQLAACEPAELTGAEREACEVLEARFGVAAPAHPEPAARKRTLAELLAEVYAAPADDGPREIYADALTERGDARGEWIVLALAEARGVLDAAGRKRKRDIELDNILEQDSWAHPLSNAADVEFARGFPVKLRLRRNAKTLVGVPELATIEVLEDIDKVAPKTLLALLDSPSAQHVRSIKTFTGPLLDRAATAKRPWTRIEIEGPTMPKPASFASLPQLVELTIRGPGEAIPADLVAAVASLRKLTIGPSTPLPDLVVPPQLSYLSLDEIDPRMELAIPPSIEDLWLGDVLPKLSFTRIPRTVGLIRVTVAATDLARLAGVRELTATLDRADADALAPLARDLVDLTLGFSSVHPETFASLHALTSLYLIGPVAKPLVLDGLRLEKLHCYASKPWPLPPMPTLRRLELSWLPDPELLARYPALEHVAFYPEKDPSEAERRNWRAALEDSAVQTCEISSRGGWRLELERDASSALIEK